MLVGFIYFNWLVKSFSWSGVSTIFFSHVFNSECLGGVAPEKHQSWFISGFCYGLFIPKDSHHENEHEEKGEVGDTAALRVHTALQIPNITDFFWRRHGRWPVLRPVSMSQEMTSGWPVNGTCVHLYIIVAGVRQRLPWHPAWLHMGSSVKRDGWRVFWAVLAMLFCEKQSCGWYFSLLLIWPHAFIEWVTATIGGCLRCSSPGIDILPLKLNCSSRIAVGRLSNLKFSIYHPAHHLLVPEFIGIVLAAVPRMF